MILELFVIIIVWNEKGCTRHITNVVMKILKAKARYFLTSFFNTFIIFIFKINVNTSMYVASRKNNLDCETSIFERCMWSFKCAYFTTSTNPKKTKQAAIFFLVQFLNTLCNVFAFLPLIIISKIQVLHHFE